MAKFKGSSITKLFSYTLLKNFTFNLIAPNLSKFLKKEVAFLGAYPSCNQRTIFSGLGNIIIGKKCSFGYKQGGFHRGGSVEIQPKFKHSKIRIGNNVSVNNNVFICAANSIEIGDSTLIGQNVTIMDFEAHGIAPDKRNQLGEIGMITIGKNVWIGNNVIILKNTTIGENSIVAAGAVVSGDFPANVIVGGIPAKIIKTI
jgi:carbonic anhydrase/acetyltransferase-like protein (isoleucine patch superfamily)